MIQKKICMLGAYAVGKTSLVERFVRSIFSEKYHTTVGVKIDKKSVRLGERDLNLILWDLYGEDAFQEVRMSYMRGASGYLLVVDGTRRSTFETACRLQKTVEETIGKVPFILVLNKTDLVDEWELGDDVIVEIEKRNWTLLRTSAKDGRGVEEAFVTLAGYLIEE